MLIRPRRPTLAKRSWDCNDSVVPSNTNTRRSPNDGGVAATIAANTWSATASVTVIFNRDRA
jgi:hypothetical protein